MRTVPLLLDAELVLDPGSRRGLAAWGGRWARLTGEVPRNPEPVGAPAVRGRGPSTGCHGCVQVRHGCTHDRERAKSGDETSITLQSQGVFEDFSPAWPRIVRTPLWGQPFTLLSDGARGLSIAKAATTRTLPITRTYLDLRGSQRTRGSDSRTVRIA